MKDYIARSEKDVWMFVDMLLRKKNANRWKLCLEDLEFGVYGKCMRGEERKQKRVQDLLVS